MNNSIYKKLNIKQEMEIFEKNKKKIQEIVKQGEENGKKILEICDIILDYAHCYMNIDDSRYIEERIIKIKKIIGGNDNEVTR